MSSENRFVPAPEANTDRIRTVLSLPYHLEDRIGLDVSFIERMCQIAGISDIKIAMDRGRVSPQIVGITSRGEAIAGFALTRTSEYSVSNDVRFPAASPAGHWSSLEVGLREQEAVMLIEAENKDVKNPEVWAKLIDKGIKKGIVYSGAENLLRRHPLQYFVPTLATGVILHDIATGYYLGGAWLSLWEVMDKFALFHEFGVERSGEGARWSLSLWSGPEVDRMIVLLVALNTRKLARGF